MAELVTAASIEELDSLLLDTQELQVGFPFPKIIHLVWFSPDNSPIPEKWTESPKAWQELHPGWKIVIWNLNMARELISLQEPDFLPTYDRFPYLIQRCDAIRPAFLKRYGGFYIDLDMVPNENIEKYFDPAQGGIAGDLYFVTHANMSFLYNNCIMASKAKHPFWDLTFEEMKKPAPGWAIGKHYTVMATTGPVMISNAIHEYDGAIIRLPWKKFNPEDTPASDKFDPKKAAIRNLQGGSWHAWDSLVLGFVRKYWDLIILILVVLIVIAIIIFLYYRRSYNTCRTEWELPARAGILPDSSCELNSSPATPYIAASLKRM